MRITIEVTTENDSFQDETGGLCEILSVIEDSGIAVLSMLESTEFDAESVLFDHNGNRCGFVRIAHEE